MRALVYHGPGSKSWEEVAKPTLQADTDAELVVADPWPTSPQACRWMDFFGYHAQRNGLNIKNDMVADGSYENGVNDVMAIDFTTPIEVAAAYEKGALVLRPRGLDGVEVRRWREGDQLVWRYHTLFTTRSERIDS